MSHNQLTGILPWYIFISRNTKSLMITYFWQIKDIVGPCIYTVTQYPNRAVKLSSIITKHEKHTRHKIILLSKHVLLIISAKKRYKSRHLTSLLPNYCKQSHLEDFWQYPHKHIWCPSYRYYLLNLFSNVETLHVYFSGDCYLYCVFPW